MLRGRVAVWQLAIVATEERASLGLGCLLADPTPKARSYWSNLGFALKGGKMWAKRPVGTKFTLMFGVRASLCREGSGDWAHSRGP